MFYAAHGASRPPATPSIARRRGALCRGAVRRRGLHRTLVLLYHVAADADASDRAGRDLELEEADDGYHHHRLIDSAGVRPRGDAVTGRIPLFFNNDIVMGVVRPAERMPGHMFYRNGEADEMLYVHEGRACSTPTSGPFATGRRLPGPADRHDLAARPGRRVATSGCCTSSARRRSRRRSAIGTTTASCSSTRRTRSATSACRTTSRRGPTRATSGPRQERNRLTAYHYRHHPFDVVGWDGYLWPFAFNIGDFQPITGRVHQPPPVHQTWAARNFVVCSFVPRKFDYHPLAIPAPYNHSNINSDEVIYYVAGNFMSRRGVGITSFTLHPAGIPHGPHPGTAEASIGKEATEELAVMVDTFHPLQDHAAGGRARGRPLPVFVAAGRRPPRRGPRALASVARRPSRTDHG